MNLRSVFRVALLAAACAFVASAAAHTLYKLIDKNGKVTYSESAPKNYDGQVIRIEVDPNANTATFPKPGPARAQEPAGERRPADPANAAKGEAELRIAAARHQLERAQQAFNDVRDNPGESDTQMVGNKGGGVRLVHSETYQRKLERLEAEVKSAEENLRRVEQGR